MTTRARPLVHLAVALAPAVLLVTSCAGSDTTVDPSPTAPGRGGTQVTATRGTNVATPSPGAPCAWPTKADKATLNVAYPDTGATYWTLSYLLAPGEQLELHGRFPSARYFSFITYGPGGGAIDVLTDRDIAPDPDQANPFRGDGSPGGTYTVRVRGNAVAAEPNTVDATSTTTTGTTAADTTPGTPVGTVLPAGGGSELLGTGTPQGPGVVGGTLIYRVYLPNATSDPTGGGGLPDVRVLHADGTADDVTTCAVPGSNPAAIAIIEANGPATNSPAPAQPVFIRPNQGAANLYPNPDNVYVVTILRHAPGQIVVVRGKAPTFPDTGRNAPITGREQVRYWSLCTDEYRKPYPVSFCAADQDVALDGDGYYTFVISTPADRPPNATAANGVTWLEWGETSVDNLLLMRHMLAAPEFAESAVRMAPGSLAAATMGPYAPKGVYCDSEAFASGGPSACPIP